MKICLLFALPVWMLYSCTGNEQKNQQTPPTKDTSAAISAPDREVYIDTVIGGRHFNVSFYGDSAIVQTDTVQRGFQLVCSHDKNSSIRIYDQGQTYHLGNFAAMGPVFVAAFTDNGPSGQTDMLIVQQQPPYAFLSTDSGGKLAWVPEPATFHSEGAMVQAAKQAVWVYYGIDSVWTDKKGVELQERWFNCTQLQPAAVGKKPAEIKIKGTGNEFADSADTEQLFRKMSRS